MIFDIFKKNTKNKEGLKKALDLDLIDKKEFLELNLKRAEKELADYTKVKVKIKDIKPRIRKR